MKYAWMKQHRDSFPVTLMCQLLEVSLVGQVLAPDFSR